MADKILSLESIKKCLEKIKELLGKKADKTELDVCVKQYEKTGEIDLNTICEAGFYRLNSNSFKNGPNIDINHGQLAVICGINYVGSNTQLVFPFFDKSMVSFAMRMGEGSNFNKEWLYFHGSTSPNIPVLKKKTISDTTSKYGSINVGSNIIPIAAYTDQKLNGKNILILPVIINNNGYIKLFDNETMEMLNSVSVKNITIYYLEIPSGYEIPDTTTAASDEPEDDEGLAPQTNENLLNENFKQFKGDLINE